jgi:RimJ/RimL family protein N-acetyltransferase
VKQDVIQELSQPAPDASCHYPYNVDGAQCRRRGFVSWLVQLIDPPEEISGPRVLLRRYRYPEDGPVLLATIAASLDHLKGWMPWAQSPPTAESVRAFFEPAARDFGGSSAANYAITLAATGEYVGGCGLHPRVGEGGVEIGYWVDPRHEGRGLITEAAGLLTTAAFRLPGISRVEIHCDQANLKSAAVPARLGYRLDRIEPDEPTAPREVGRSMIWVIRAGDWAQQESNL